MNGLWEPPRWKRGLCDSAGAGGRQASAAPSPRQRPWPSVLQAGPSRKAIQRSLPPRPGPGLSRWSACHPSLEAGGSLEAQLEAGVVGVCPLFRSGQGPARLLNPNSLRPLCQTHALFTSHHPGSPTSEHPERHREGVNTLQTRPAPGQSPRLAQQTPATR